MYKPKKCTKCSRYKDVSEFYEYRSKQRSWCKKCVGDYNKSISKRSNELQLTRYFSNKKRLCQYLRGCACADCGENNIIVLEFDHVRGVKKKAVTQLLHASWDLICAEIDKCDIVCANCHKIRTATRNKDFKTSYV